MTLLGQVAINDTIYTQAGATWKGYVEISWPAFTTASGIAVARGTRVVSVTDGSFSVSLYPNDGATPGGVAYSATFRGATTWTETWLLAASPSTHALADVRTSSTLVTSVAGQRGAVVLTKSDVGLGNVDNTSDAGKPVSTAQQAALDGKANLSGGNTFTGNQTIGTTAPPANAPTGSMSAAAGYFGATVIDPLTGAAATSVPAPPSGMSAWFAADKITGKSDGDAISSWSDLSGNGRHAVQATGGAQPTYKAGILAGKPVVRFAGAQSLQLPYTAAVGGIFIVGRTTSLTGSQTFLGGKRSGAQTYATVYFGGKSNAGPGSYFQVLVTADGNGPNSWSTAAGNAKNVYYIQSGTLVGTAMKLYLNGDLGATNTTASSAYTLAELSIGSTYWAGTANADYLTGDIAEVLVYPSMTDALAAQVHAYLKAKWFPRPVTGKYLLASFEIGDTSLRTFSSDTGYAWNEIVSSFVPPSAALTTPALYRAPGGRLWIAYTPKASFADIETTFSLAYTDDRQIWRYSREVDCSSITGVVRVWAPKWFTEPNGAAHVLFAASTEGGASTSRFTLYETHPMTSDPGGAWSTPVALAGDFTAYAIDPHILQVGSTLHMYWKDNNTGHIKHSTSTDLLTGWTTVGDYNWNSEGPFLVQLDTGAYRVYYDRYVALTGIAYRDSVDLVNWGSEIGLSSGSTVTRHGTILTLQ